MHYKFRHQFDDNHNRQYSPISFERTWATNFWEDRNCVWYLATSEVNTNLAWGHFQQYGKVDATLDFWRKLAHECLVNLVGVDKDNEDVVSRPLRTFRMPKKGTRRLARAPKYHGVWIYNKKKEQSQTKTPKTKVHELFRVQK